MAGRITHAQREALYAQIKPLYERGLNSREIGAELGMSAVAAAAHICAMGLPPRPPAKDNKGKYAKPAKAEAPAPVPFVSRAQTAAAAGWRPLGNRERVALDLDISRALAAVRNAPSDEAAKERLQVLIARRDRDDCARAAVRLAA